MHRHRDGRGGPTGHSQLEWRRVPRCGAATGYPLRLEETSTSLLPIPQSEEHDGGINIWISPVCWRCTRGHCRRRMHGLSEGGASSTTVSCYQGCTGLELGYASRGFVLLSRGGNLGDGGGSVLHVGGHLYGTGIFCFCFNICFVEGSHYASYVCPQGGVSDIEARLHAPVRY